VRHIRSIVFDLFLIIWTLIFGIVFSPSLFMPKKYIFLATRFYAHIVLIGLKIICKIDYKIQLESKLPKAPFIIASKHSSIWETIFFIYYFNNPNFILKKELLFIPVFGQYLWRMGMIAINRSRATRSSIQIVKESKKAIKKKFNIVIFPQGTRVNRDSTKPYKSGVYSLAKELNLPVVPIALNSGDFWPKDKFIKSPGTIKIIIGNSFKTDNQSKKEFMHKMTQWIENNCKKIY
jgi:1-acyl-sn-glycerol-3-phosphate acyltransferase